MIPVCIALIAIANALLDGDSRGLEAPDPHVSQPVNPYRDQEPVAIDPRIEMKERQPGAVGASQLQVYRIIDARNKAPIASASLLSARTGSLIAVTGEDGEAEARGRGPSQIVFSAPGYLLAFHHLTSPGLRRIREAAAETGVFEISLEPDVYTIPFALRFVTSHGEKPSRVSFHVKCLHDLPPSGNSVPTDRIGTGAPINHELRQAWAQHALLSGLSGFSEQMVHLGQDSSAKLFEVAAEANLRFVAAGPYQIEARSAEGDVARATLHVARRQAEPEVIELRSGQSAEGLVIDAANGEPVEGAIIMLRTSAIGVGEITSNIKGQFSLGPLTGAPFTLDVQHDWFEDASIGPRRPGKEVFKILMRRKPVHVIKGKVRSRTDQSPVAGATVSLRRFGEVDAKTVTAEDGWFELRSQRVDPELVVAATGYYVYVEVIDPTAPPTMYDLIPDSPEARMRAGMTALLSGVARTAKGAPASGTPVMLVSEEPLMLQGIVGRRILEGGVLRMNSHAMTDGDGRFVIECMAPGPATVRVAGIDHAPKHVHVVLGTHVKGLDLRSSH